MIKRRSDGNWPHWLVNLNEQNVRFFPNGSISTKGRNRWFVIYTLIFLLTPSLCLALSLVYLGTWHIHFITVIVLWLYKSSFFMLFLLLFHWRPSIRAETHIHIIFALFCLSLRMNLLFLFVSALSAEIETAPSYGYISRWTSNAASFPTHITIKVTRLGNMRKYLPGLLLR